jgi:putative membrane protein
MKKTLIAVGLISAILLPFLASARMMGFNGYGMMGGRGSWFGWGGLIIGFVFWVLVIIFIIAIIRWAVRGGRHSRWERKDSAIEILKERYAKGEIKKEEFEEKMKDLVK